MTRVIILQRKAVSQRDRHVVNPALVGTRQERIADKFVLVIMSSLFRLIQRRREHIFALVARD